MVFGRIGRSLLASFFPRVADWLIIYYKCCPEESLWVIENHPRIYIYTSSWSYLCSNLKETQSQWWVCCYPDYPWSQKCFPGCWFGLQPFPGLLICISHTSSGLWHLGICQGSSDWTKMATVQGRSDALWAFLSAPVDFSGLCALPALVGILWFLQECFINVW